MEYLNNNPIDRSKLFREAVEQHKTQNKKKDPLLFMACTMGIIMGTVLILVSLLNFLSFEIKIFLPILGGILSVVSAYVYMNNTRKIKVKKGA